MDESKYERITRFTYEFTTNKRTDFMYIFFGTNITRTRSGLATSLSFMFTERLESRKRDNNGKKKFVMAAVSRRAHLV